MDQDTVRDRVLREFSRTAVRWGTLRFPAETEWVLEHTPVDGAPYVLDVGTGSGMLAFALAPHVGHVTGIDVTPAMLEQARARAIADAVHNVTFRVGTAEALDVPDASHDLVITRWLLHHVLDPLAVLRELGRACRPGGHVVVVDVVAPEDAAERDRLNAAERLCDPSHVRTLSPREVEGLFAGCGLTIASTARRVFDMPLRFSEMTPSRAEVMRAVDRELAGGPATGLRPFRTEIGLMHAVEMKLWVLRAPPATS